MTTFLSRVILKCEGFHSKVSWTWLTASQFGSDDFLKLEGAEAKQVELSL